MEFKIWNQVPESSNNAGQQVLRLPIEQMIFLHFFPYKFFPTEYPDGHD